MVGTPPAEVQRSRSISCMAVSGSQRRISTMVPPANTVGIRIAWQPVAWKKGTANKTTRLDASAGGLSPRRTQAWAPEYAAAMIAEVEFRWVPRAPLGCPVVPDV